MSIKTLHAAALPEIFLAHISDEWAARAIPPVGVYDKKDDNAGLCAAIARANRAIDNFPAHTAISKLP